MIFSIIFSLVIVLIIIKQFAKPKQDDEYDDSNYIVYENTIDKDTSHKKYMHQKNTLNPNNMSLGSTIYILLFTLIWNSIIFIMIFTSKTLNRNTLIILLPFIIIGIYLLIICFISIKNYIKKKKSSNQYNSSNNTNTINSEYFVKYCINCGESLNEQDQYCPSCGKEVNKK